MGIFKAIRRGLRVLSKGAKEIQKFEKMDQDRWKRVDHFPPPQRSLVLLSDGLGVSIGTWTGKIYDGVCPLIDDKEITHWRLLPALPFKRI